MLYGIFFLVLYIEFSYDKLSFKSKKGLGEL